jgi:hypothetical protein
MKCYDFFFSFSLLFILLVGHFHSLFPVSFLFITFFVFSFFFQLIVFYSLLLRVREEHHPEGLTRPGTDPGHESKFCP